MGIKGLWEILGDGQITSIAKLATTHFKRTGRPLRIAVDEPGWRFNNLTPYQVQQIRQKEPRANPIEKAILYRILRLMRLNIRLLFVFDGPCRPWKRDKRSGGRIDYNEISLLKKVLDRLAIPCHRSPAEAEAECAKLQSQGIVDAVWSDDGDALMFGCTFLIRDYRTEGKGASTKKSDSHVRVYQAKDLLEKYGLDRPGLVLFAVLSGGDYDTTGLKGCGPQLARKMAKTGLGIGLCELSKHQLGYWVHELQVQLWNVNSCVQVPPDFPLFRAVEHYRNPKVSSPAQLHDLRGLKRGWDVEMDPEKLRPFLTENFQIWTKGFLKHVGPALLARKLLRHEVMPSDKEANWNIYDIAVVPRRAKRAKENNAEEDESGEIKITFDPKKLISFDLTVQPPNENWSELKSKDGGLFDATKRVECEMPEAFLRHVLPAEIFDVRAAPKRAKKRKGDEAALDGGDAPDHLTEKRRATTPKLKASGNANFHPAPSMALNAPIVLDLASDNEDQVSCSKHFAPSTPHFDLPLEKSASTELENLSHSALEQRVRISKSKSWALLPSAEPALDLQHHITANCTDLKPKAIQIIDLTDF